MAEEMFPQFGSSEAQCTKDPNKLMLGKYRDYCGNGMRAVAMAEEMFPQFGSSEAQCTKDPNKLMLGNYLKRPKYSDTLGT